MPYPMQVVVLNPTQGDMGILSGAVTALILPASYVYRPGETAILYCPRPFHPDHRGAWAAEIDIEYAVNPKVSAIQKRDWQRAGFWSREEMLGTLSSQRRGLVDDTHITVVAWKKIHGELVRQHRNLFG